MTNSQRFITAFNRLDKAVRAIYNIKSNVGFSEMIRQTGNKNALLKYYKDDLYNYSQLRNAIIHNAIDDEVIAEPHTKVVEHLEYILEQVKTPPLVKDVLEQEKVVAVNVLDTLKTFLIGSVEHNFTHTPVYDDGRVVGIINAKHVTEALGNEILQKGYLKNDYLTSATVGQVMNKNPSDYMFESAQLSVVQAITYFQENRSLKAILVTKNGDSTAPVLRIVTASDTVEFQKRIF